MYQRSSVSSNRIDDIVYAIPLSHPEKCSGETPIYRHPETLQRLPTTINRVPHLTTLQALHGYAFQEYANLDCLGTRVRNPDGSVGHFQFKSYKMINKTAQQVGSAILNMGLAPVISVKENPDCRFIVIYAANSEEWLTLDIAASLYGLTVVPIFANLGVESLQYIFEHTSASTIFSSKANLDRLLKDSSERKIANLKNIVCFEGYTQQQKTFSHKANVQLLSWKELLTFGENNVLPYPIVTPDTVFTIQYTSGTTGNPKGAILTHGNFIAAYAGSENKLGYDLQAINKGDVHLSYLPLAHIFERFFAHLVLFRGCTIGIFSGDVQKLTDDLQALKPTFMISVPRLFKRFYDIFQAILHKVAPMTDPHNDPIDPKVLKQLRNVTGGRVKAYYSGSAPLDPNIAKFLKKAFSAPIIETFGQTEISGGGFSQRVDDDTFGHIGGNLSGLEFKLVDVPDMEYTSKDKASNGEPMPRGELCLRGAQIFKGYYKEAEKTEETIDEYGWHHTGDIGMILPNGAVKLIDRRKNIFKLSQGEFIAPEKIENVYLNNKYVTEAFIYGDPLKSYTVGIIVPDRENLTDLAKKLGIENRCYEELCKDADITAYMLQETKNTGRGANLAGYEIAQAIYLESNPLSAQGLMTFTMKLKRDIAKKQYNQIIHELYEKEEILRNSRL